MFYVYVLKNKSNKELYYGCTTDVNRRLKEHNAKDKWQLVYYEAYVSKHDAREREQKLKHYGQSRKHLKNRIRRSLQSQN